MFADKKLPEVKNVEKLFVAAKAKLGSHYDTPEANQLWAQLQCVCEDGFLLDYC